MLYLSLINDGVNQSIGQRLLRRHIVVPLRVSLNGIHRLSRVLRKDPVQTLPALQHMVRHDFNIRSLSLNPIAMDGRLMYHDLRVGKGHPFSLCPARQQKRAEAGGKYDSDGGYIAFDILDGIINFKPCRD